VSFLFKLLFLQLERFPTRITVPLQLNPRTTFSKMWPNASQRIAKLLLVHLVIRFVRPVYSQGRPLSFTSGMTPVERTTPTALSTTLCTVSTIFTIRIT